MDNSKDEADQGWLSEVEELHLRESLTSQMGGAGKFGPPSRCRSVECSGAI